MLEYRNGKYIWETTQFMTFKLVLKRVCEDVLRYDTTPKFGDMGRARMSTPELQQYLLLYAVYNLDVLALLQSSNAEAYKRMTGSTDPVLVKYIKSANPLYTKTMHMPLGYESNRAMQCTLLPRLEKVYNTTPCTIHFKKGKYPHVVAFSYVCDMVLFNQRTSPYSNDLDMFQVLGNDSRTAGLDLHVSHGDYNRLRVLAAQLRAGDITVPMDSFISIGDLRKGRYSYASHEKFPDVDCIQLMIDCPPSMHSDKYEEWFATAMEVGGYEFHKDITTRIVAKETLMTQKEESISDSKPVSFVGEIPENIADQMIKFAAVRGDNAKDTRSLKELGKEITLPDMPMTTERVELKLSTAEIANATMSAKENDAFVAEVLANSNIKSIRENRSLRMCEADRDMEIVGRVYCNLNDTPYEDILGKLWGVGITSWEDVFRALPVLLRREGKAVDVTVLTEYSRSLDKYYGGYTLKSDFGDTSE